MLLISDPPTQKEEVVNSKVSLGCATVSMAVWDGVALEAGMTGFDRKAGGV